MKLTPKDDTGLLPAADNPYEAQGMTPLEMALAKKRKKLALSHIGHLSDEDQERLGILNAGN